ncbi:hypothetical protein KPH14_008682 [Odynerus spinipes]|uniref:Protein mesh n=1 Tax=Odynerus spinipes TaxID=1348599 RepID=A0AAD9VN06_9HYME|nr:hypothetical protein KPH14_008682 [Odynerus spinipes]
MRSRALWLGGVFHPRKLTTTTTIVLIYVFAVSLSGIDAQTENETFESAFGLNVPESTENKDYAVTERKEEPVPSELEDLARSEKEIVAIEEKPETEFPESPTSNFGDAKKEVGPISVGLSGRIAGETSGKYVRYDSDSPDANRCAPRSDDSVPDYVFTEARLKKIRSEFMYWYFDKCGDNDNGDYQTDIHASTAIIHKNFNFQLPFFGFRYNYTRVSVNGFLEFSDPPEHYTYPLVFPIKDWPERNDPSFIGIFFSLCRIGKIRPTDIDPRKPGVYFRLERDLQRRTDQFGVEMRERVKWDIREGVVGSDSFDPKHAVIVTWKNISFVGGLDNSLYKTNTFQLVLATDEVYTYAIFNYLDIQWSSHTSAGGDTTGGEGGVPAFVGFNAGNGTQSYEYKPYSQATTLRDLTSRGWANGFPGRHIFRIDEKIMLGTCNKDIAGTHLPLVFAPESGNMLGGTVVNITGPCFNENEKVRCLFDTVSVIGHVVDRNRAICVQPYVQAEGYVRFEVAIGNSGKYNWKGKYFIETPATAAEKISFATTAIHEIDPAEIKITWNQYNLTSNSNAGIQISLWGYRETKTTPELKFISDLEPSYSNTGSYVIRPSNYRDAYNPDVQDMVFGFIKINLTDPAQYSGINISPVLWSKPIPLAWYFAPQWERLHGSRWSQKMCDKWIMNDRYLKNFAAEVALCPCTLEHALYDKGRFMPDFDCDKDSNPDCFYNNHAVHCVRTGAPNLDGSEQQCCYDKNGFLMLTYDQQWGSRPRRSHNLGYFPWNEANKVPTLSQWYHDMVPMYLCCLWQEEQAVGCETFRFERRPSQDCIAYQSPAVATVFGDPHVVTFDGLPYTFNGMGEFVLLRVNYIKDKLDVQARFEQVDRNFYGPVNATKLTAIAVRGNNSATIEIRLRPKHAQWRYRLDVFADKRRVYFDRPSLKFQHFPGVIVYTPTYILNQSEVIVMLDTGVGVEVIENEGFLTARAYIPWSYMNKTRGLFGNWSHDITDDFTNPDGQLAAVSNLNNFEEVHKNFAMNWLLEDKEVENKGAALFTREFGRTATFYANRKFQPEFRRTPEEILPANRTEDRIRANALCGDSYQCKYDYAMTLNRDFAHFTKNYYDTYTQIKAINDKKTISCGILETPRFGRKTNFLFIPGAKVTFECNQDFILVGDQRRECMPNGRWNVPEYGYTECLRQQEYSSRQAGITTGIVLACVVPIVLLIVCIASRALKQRREEREQDESLTRARNLELQRLRKIGEDDDSEEDSKYARSRYENLDDNEPINSSNSDGYRYNSFKILSSNIIGRIVKYVWHTAMARPWLGVLFGILVPSTIFYLYLLFNVPSVEIGVSKVQGKWQSLSIGIEKMTLRESSSERVQLESNRVEVKCDTVHIAMVCAGYNSTFTLVTVVKSVLFYRTKPLHFHLLVDEIAKRTLTTLFQTWDLPHVTVTYYPAERWVPKVSWIPNKHYSGVYGLLKLILPEALGESKVLVLDTDVTILNDVAVLWRVFEKFTYNQTLGLVENQSHWYIKSLSYGQRPWPALGRGFNTGVMLMHLQRLRDRRFRGLWESTTRRVLERIRKTSLADQDVINAVIKEHPDIVRRIDCTWNIQLSDHTTSESCYRGADRINIIHWNSPRKQDAYNKHINEFRKLHRVFLEMDGNLLRKRLFGCDRHESNRVYNESSPCREFAKGATMMYRTHPFVLEYEYNVYIPTDVVLATQCSIERVPLLEELSKHWPGTLSVALYLTDAEVQNFFEFVRGSAELRKRKNIAYHVVYKDGELYPINYLRNVAMSYVSTPFIFQLDVDFLPQYGLYESLMNHIAELRVGESHKIALIVPAFETERYRFTFPANKEELLKFLRRGVLYTFRYHVWTQGHAATNYSFWRNATEPYEVSWEPDFEPYIVVSRSAPRYDTRFIGFGWNKVSYITHLTALGYKYIVLPNTFIIHRPHAPSLDIGKFRTNSIYRRCLKKLKDEFVEELITKYGDGALSKLKRITKEDKILGPAKPH